MTIQLPPLPQPESRLYRLDHSLIDDPPSGRRYHMRATFMDLDGTPIEVTWTSNPLTRLASADLAILERLTNEGRARVRNKIIDILEKGRFTTVYDPKRQSAHRVVRGLRQLPTPEELDAAEHLSREAYVKAQGAKP